jgi:hypothetical protein
MADGIKGGDPHPAGMARLAEMLPAWNPGRRRARRDKLTRGLGDKLTGRTDPSACHQVTRSPGHPRGA